MLHRQTFAPFTQHSGGAAALLICGLIALCALTIWGTVGRSFQPTRSGHRCVGNGEGHATEASCLWRHNGGTTTANSALLGCLALLAATAAWTV
jgi:hypothetical protein